MPRLATNKLDQDAVLYAAADGDTLNSVGERTLAAGVDLSVRWEERQKEALDGQGNTITLDATAIVGQEILIGSLLWHGALADLPSPVTDLYKVVTRSTIPSIRGDQTRRVLGLQRYSDSLPSLV